MRDHAGPLPVQRGAAGGLPLRQLRGDEEGARRRSSTTWPSGTRRSQVAHDARRPQGGRLPLGDPVRHHHRHRRRGDPAEEGRDPRPVREGRREDREAVPARCDHRGGAPSGARRGLDQGDQRGRQGDGGQLPEDQPGLHHGQLRCPRKHDADAADRRHAWPGGQPEGRDHPAADQGELPRGPVRAGVLHRHARRPQGSGRHRAAYRRLGLPDPAAGGRLAGRDHPRGGLRHRARRHAGDRDAGADGTLVKDVHVETAVYARVLAEDVKVDSRPRWPRPARTSATC